MVLSATPRSSSSFNSSPTWPSCLHHAVGIEAEPGLALRLLLQMREDVHPRRVEVAEPRLARPCCWRLMKSFAAARNSSSTVSMRLVVERAGVLDRLLADAPECRIDRRIVAIARLALEHAARTELLAESRVLRVVGILRLLLGIEVIEVAEELVEAVHRRQMLVAVAEMVLAELAGGVAERLHDVGDARIERPEAELGAGQADLGQAGADRRLAGDEGGAAGGAALLAIPVGEDRAFLADAVDVGRAVAHDAHVVGADVEPADVVAHDEQDVRLAARRRAAAPALVRPDRRARAERGRCRERGAAEQNACGGPRTLFVGLRLVGS